MMATVEESALKLALAITRSNDVAVALSGGIDSLVLSAAVHAASRNGSIRYTLFHAVSAAVSQEATQRVVACARDNAWNLRLIDANEFKDESYLSNPSNRCFYCKSSLYRTIHSLTTAQIFSGTNVDDLSDYRPGLEAARDYDVRHPFVEAEIDKKMIRQLAEFYGLGAFAKLPASPCLSSRVETGIYIEPAQLVAVDKIEHLVADRFASQNVRLRLRHDSVVIELDEELVEQVAHELETNSVFVDEIRRLLDDKLESYPLSCAPYVRGSAFLKVAR